MELSSALCREQEAIQRARAASATLQNVRTIAENAAAAWSIEALTAEKRERRRSQARLAAAELLKEKEQSREQSDRRLSENPDRGFANT